MKNINLVKVGVYSTLALLVIILISGSVFTIDQGDRGVILRNGAISDVASPGLGFKIPIITTVKEVSVQQQSVFYKNQPAYSYDQQPANMNVSVSYHVPSAKVSDLYAQYGSLDNLVLREISRQVPTQLENTFGRYTAVSVVQDRSKFVADLMLAIKASVASAPVVIDSVQVENIDFSDAYEHSIEARMAAEIEVEKKQQELKTAEVQAKIQVTNAQANADSQVAEATAKAKSIELMGNAEAQAIKVKADALAQNANLTQYQLATKWNGVLPTTMTPDGAVPFIKINK